MSPRPRLWDDLETKGAFLGIAALVALLVALAIHIFIGVTAAPPLPTTDIPYAPPQQRVASLSDDAHFTGPFVSWPSFSVRGNWVVSVKYWDCNSHLRPFRVTILGLRPHVMMTLVSDLVNADKRAYRIARGGTYRLKVVIPDVEAGCHFRVVAGYG